MSIKESTAKKNYSNKSDKNIKVAKASKLKLGVYQNPRGDRTKKSSNIKVASAKQIKKNKKLSNIILNELMSDYVLEDLKKKK